MIADIFAEGTEDSHGVVQGPNQGMVKVFRVNGWKQLGKEIFGDNPEDLFGTSMSFGKNGNRLAIGSFSQDEGVSYARIYDYDWVEDAWTLKGEEIGEVETELTVSLSENGKRLAIGLPDKESLTGAFRVYKYRNKNGERIWDPIGEEVAGYEGDLLPDLSLGLFGQSIAFSNNGKKLAVAGQGFAQIFQYKKKSWIPISGIIERSEDIEDGSLLEKISISGDGKTVAFGEDSTKVLKYE